MDRLVIVQLEVVQLEIVQLTMAICFGLQWLAMVRT